MVELNTAATKPQQTAAELSNNNGEPARPEGRDSGKRRKAQGTPDTSVSSTAFAVLQQMNDRCEESGQQQSAHRCTNALYQSSPLRIYSICQVVTHTVGVTIDSEVHRRSIPIS